MHETYELDIKSYERRYKLAESDAMQHLMVGELPETLLTIATMIEYKAAIKELRYQQQLCERLENGR